MNRRLRKRHWQAWCLLSVLLPVGIFTAWQAIPCYAPVTAISGGPVIVPGVAVDSIQRPSFTVILRHRSPGDSLGNWQLEWINNRPLNIPTALIYRTDAGYSQRWYTGRVEAGGRFLFSVPAGAGRETSLHFVVSDPIHETNIDTLNFPL